MALVVAVGASVPPLRARAKAVAVLTTSIGIHVPRPFARRVSVRTIRPAAGLTGDLYASGGGPPIVLASGATPQGKDDPRLVRVARSLAGANRTVFVPQLELRRQVFVWSDVRALIASVQVLHRMTGGTVGMVGFSYGGSFSIIAAEDPRIAEEVAFVAVFGSFDRLLSVVQGVTTGATTYGGRVVPWHTVPEATGIMDRAAEGLLPRAQREPLVLALSARDPSGLGPGTRAVYDLLENRDPRRTVPLAAALPESFRAELDRFSPATAIRRLRAPVFVMQSRDDPATPPTEALALHASVPGSRLILLRYYLHVSPPGAGTPIVGRLADGWGAVRFVSWVLAAQE